QLHVCGRDEEGGLRRKFGGGDGRAGPGDYRGVLHSYRHRGRLSVSQIVFHGLTALRGGWHASVAFSVREAAGRPSWQGAKDVGLPSNDVVDCALRRRRRSPFPERTGQSPGNRGGPRLAMESGGVAILPGVVAGGLLDYWAQHGDRL